MSHPKQNERSRMLLQDAGLRPTRQRMALASLLLDGYDKHMTAEEIHDAMRRSRTRISLATVYNALHQFTAAGLLRQVMIDGASIYFDTNTSMHHHFFDTVTGRLEDIPAESVRIARLPKLPKGRKLDRVDVVIRVGSQDLATAAKRSRA